jgi:hypothetical protein
VHSPQQRGALRGRRSAETITHWAASGPITVGGSLTGGTGKHIPASYRLRYCPPACLGSGEGCHQRSDKPNIWAGQKIWGVFLDPPSPPRGKGAGPPLPLFRQHWGRLVSIPVDACPGLEAR